MLPGFSDETYPADGEVMVSEKITAMMDVSMGDNLTLELPDGSTKVLKIIGFNQDTAVASEYDAVALFVNLKTFRDRMQQ